MAPYTQLAACTFVLDDPRCAGLQWRHIGFVVCLTLGAGSLRPHLLSSAFWLYASPRVYLPCLLCRRLPSTLRALICRDMDQQAVVKPTCGVCTASKVTVQRLARLKCKYCLFNLPAARRSDRGGQAGRRRSRQALSERQWRAEKDKQNIQHEYASMQRSRGSGSASRMAEALTCARRASAQACLRMQFARHAGFVGSRWATKRLIDCQSLR